MPRPVAIDLFAGAGGMSLGFEQAGFDVVAAVEVDPIHAAVHAFNFPATTVLPNSVIGLSGEAIREACKIGNRPVDLVVGGAPCQGFSSIGKRVLDDPRNRLVLEFVRLVTELDARYFVFENVKGITYGPQRQILDELVAAFEAAGYDIRLPWSVLNAASFGVPQSRERLILMGAKRGERLPEYPALITRAAGSRGNNHERPSCAEALDDLPDAEAFTALIDSDEVRVKSWRAMSAYAADMRCASEEAWHFGYRRDWDDRLLTSSNQTRHTPISRRRFKATHEGAVEPISRFFKLPSNGVSNTLRAGTDSARGAFTSPRPIHYALARCITVREMARLHGFPDWFRLHVTKWHGARQIGNAVPPALARNIGLQIISAMGISPTLPSETLELGDTDLLRFDAGRAATYWGVQNPIGRRDKRSGATKRKQIDIERSLGLIAAE